MSDDKKITDIGDAQAKAGRPRREDALKLALAQPVSVSFLAEVFSKDRRTIASRLKGVRPVGRQGKSDLYDISQAAEAIFSEPRTKPASEDDLTPGQQMALWAARKSKVAVYRETGALWHADHIRAAFDETFKVFRNALLSLPERAKQAECADETLTDVAYAILESVEVQIAKELKDLGHKAFSETWSTVSDEEAAALDTEDEDDDGEDE